MATAIALFATVGASPAYAVCIPTAYSVVSLAPPATANWTDSTGTTWTPAGGYPGCAPGDTASDTNASPTTIVIDSVIANPIIGLNLACSGCVIDIQPGGQLTLAGPGSIGSAATLKVSGGTLTIAPGGDLTLPDGATFQFTGGIVDVQPGGQIDGPHHNDFIVYRLAIANGSLIVDGSVTVPVTIGSGGILSGAGTLSDYVAVGTGGTLSPGHSPAIINIAHLEFTAGSTLLVELDGTDVGTEYDQVNLSGAYVGGATLDVALGFLPAAGTVFTIVNGEIGGRFWRRIDADRHAIHLPLMTWTDPVLVAGASAPRVVHLLELRSALAKAYQVAGLALPAYMESDASIVAGQTGIKAAQIEELRVAIVNYEVARTFGVR